MFLLIVIKNNNNNNNNNIILTQVSKVLSRALNSTVFSEHIMELHVKI